MMSPAHFVNSVRIHLDTALGSLDWSWGISSSPWHCDPLTWSHMTFSSGPTPGVPFVRNPWKYKKIWYPESSKSVEQFRAPQNSVRGCSRRWYVAAVPAVKSKAATSKSSYILVESYTIKTIQCTTSWHLWKWKPWKKHLSPKVAPAGCLPP